MKSLNQILLLFVCLASIVSARQPNVILIMADDLGWTELGSYGQKLIQTPYLDKLAADGMKFSAAYSGNAVCPIPMRPHDRQAPRSCSHS